MRRKLFAVLVAQIIIIYMLDFFSAPLAPGDLADRAGEQLNYTGTVKEIRVRENKVQLIVAVDGINGTECRHKRKVLLNIYDGFGSSGSAAYGSTGGKSESEVYETERDVFKSGGKAFEKRAELEEKYGELYLERIEFSAALKLPAQSANPHTFNYRKYLKSEGTDLTGTLKHYKALPDTNRKGPEKLRVSYLKYLRKVKLEFICRLSEDSRGLIAGITFGDTSYLDEDEFDNFRKNGTAHILAVSGLHVGILYELYKKIFGNRKSTMGTAILVLVLFTYGSLSLWRPSTVRACAMILLSMLGKNSDRRYDSLTAMSFIGILMIQRNPYVVFGTSFQMSFMAISSLAFIAPALKDKVPESVRASMSVTLGILPYQICCFNYVSLFSVLINIPIVYLTGYLVPVSVLAFFMFTAFGSLAVTGVLMDGMAGIITKINDFTTLGGAGTLEVNSLPAGVALLMTLILFYICSEQWMIDRKKKRMLSAVCILLAALVFEITAFSPITHDDLVFVNVGQGDCIHICLRQADRNLLKPGHKDILIDGGGSVSYNTGKNTLKPYLQKNGHGKTELSMATHTHTDHYKGLEELKECGFNNVICTGMTMGNAVNMKNLNAVEDITEDGETENHIETLWPISLENDREQEENRSCSVFMVHLNGARILITGDLDSEGEEAMVRYYEGTDRLKADILKISHHGSRFSTSQMFLDAVKPQYAVIQVGVNNYGHPAPEIIEKCQKSGIMVLRNDINGAVGFRLRKNSIICHTMY